MINGAPGCGPWCAGSRPANRKGCQLGPQPDFFLSVQRDAKQARGGGEVSRGDGDVRFFHPWNDAEAGRRDACAERFDIGIRPRERRDRRVADPAGEREAARSDRLHGQERVIQAAEAQARRPGSRPCRAVAGSSAQLRDASSGTRNPPAPSASTTSTPSRRRACASDDARRVDRDAGFGRRDVRRDRGLEQPGVHERVGMAHARLGLELQRVLVRRALGPGDRCPPRSASCRRPRVPIRAVP